jgi:hypothetical protein
MRVVGILGVRIAEAKTHVSRAFACVGVTFPPTLLSTGVYCYGEPITQVVLIQDSMYFTLALLLSARVSGIPVALIGSGAVRRHQQRRDAR